MASLSRLVVVRYLSQTKQVRFSSSSNRDFSEDPKSEVGYMMKKNGKLLRLWRNIWYFVSIPCILATAWLAYKDHIEDKKKPRKQYIPYKYLAIRTSVFPWGDGNHGLFHNPEANWVPGVGYEKEKGAH